MFLVFLSVCILVNASCLTIYLSFIYKILSRYFELVFQSSAAVSVSGSSLLGSHSHRFHISTLIQGLQHSPQQSWQCIMSGGKVGYLHDSKTRDSAIEARGVSQTTATSPIDNGSHRHTIGIPVYKFFSNIFRYFLITKPRI